MDEPLPLQDPFYPTVYDWYVPGYTTLAKPVRLRLSVPLRQKLHCPVAYDENRFLVEGIDDIQASLILVC